MKNFAYKFIVFTLTFFLVFNSTSIVHAHTYETTNNIIKLEPQNSFFLKEDIKTILLTQEKIDLDIKSEMLNHTSYSYFVTLISSVPLFISLFIVLGLFIGISYSLFNRSPSGDIMNLIVIIMPIITNLILNSIIVYFVGKNRQNYSYLMTLLGSIVGYIVYMAIISLLIVLESYLIIDANTTTTMGLRVNNNQGFIVKNQEIFLAFIMPLFSSIGGTIFYHISKKEEKSTPNETIKASMSPEELISKIKTQKGSFSFKIADF